MDLYGSENYDHTDNNFINHFIISFIPSFPVQLILLFNRDVLTIRYLINPSINPN